MQTAPRVLVVEDEELIAEVLEYTLLEEGFAVQVCATGEQAISALEEQLEAYQVLLTDIRLPGCNGWDVAHRAREFDPSICVVYVTGDRRGEWSSKGVPNSVLIEKPYVSAQIITAVSTLLNNSDFG